MIVPFSSIYQNIQVEGKFKVKKPIISLSHQMDTSQASYKLFGNVLGENIVNSTETLLEIYITLNPALSKPVKIEEVYIYFLELNMAGNSNKRGRFSS